MAACRVCPRFPTWTVPRASYSSFAPHQAPLEWWYPGHMVKGMRQMQKVLKTVDCVIEVHDARIPFTGRNPMLRDRLSAIKPLVVTFNKSDLIPPNAVVEIRKRMSSGEVEQKVEAVFTGMDAAEKDSRRLVNVVKRLVRGAARYQRRDAPEFNVMVVGVPNVGKSTVINRLRRIGIGSSRKGGAPVGAIAGVTRTIAKMKISEDPLIYVFDTPGILEPSVKDRDAAFKLALCSALPDERLGQTDIASYLLSWLASNPNFDASTLPKLLGHDFLECDQPIDFESFKKHYSTPINILCCDHAASRGWTKSFKSPATSEITTIPDLQRAAGDILRLFRAGHLGKFCLDLV